MIEVLDYSPKEGKIGMLITVHVNVVHDLAVPIYLRVLFGDQALRTIVRKRDTGTWKLSCKTPSKIDSSDNLSVSVQALSEDSTVLESTSFGEFYVLGDELKAMKTQATSEYVPKPALRSKERKATREQAEPSTSSKSTTKTRGRRKSSTSSGSSLQDSQSGILMRTRELSKMRLSSAQTPILEIITPFRTMCSNWTSEELENGRRLVQFSGVQDGRKLIITCDAVQQQDFKNTNDIISCIYRPESTAHYFTSVDIIRLLECLTKNDFPIAEKNRIRRNLEFLKPTTVSKRRPELENLYHRIVDFPDPKPRSIGKDIKVFDWGQLGAALDKILSRYSLVADTSGASGSISSNSLMDTPQLVPSDPIPKREITYDDIESVFDYYQMELGNTDLMLCDSSSDQLSPSNLSPEFFMMESPQQSEDTDNSPVDYNAVEHSTDRQSWMDLVMMNEEHEDKAVVTPSYVGEYEPLDIKCLATEYDSML